MNYYVVRQPVLPPKNPFPNHSRQNKKKLGTNGFFIETKKKYVCNNHPFHLRMKRRRKKIQSNKVDSNKHQSFGRPPYLYRPFVIHEKFYEMKRNEAKKKIKKRNSICRVHGYQFHQMYVSDTTREQCGWRTGDAEAE